MTKKYNKHSKLGKIIPFYSKTILKKGKKYCKIKTHILYCDTNLSSSNVDTPSFDGDRCYTEYKKTYKRNDKTSCEVTKGVKEGIHMTNIVDVAKFLIQLYFKTGKKYRCTRTKIEKLLSISNIIMFANDNAALFDANILVNKCGVGIPVLSGFFYSDILDGSEPCVAIPKSELDESSAIYNIYLPSRQLSCDEEKVLKKVFLRFGAYDALSLGKMFDEFKDEISIPNNIEPSHPLIDREKSNIFFSQYQSYSKFVDNEIVEFIINFTL